MSYGFYLILEIIQHNYSRFPFQFEKKRNKLYYRSIKFVVENIDNLRKAYTNNSTSNEFSFNGESENVDILSWFN